MYKYGMRLRPVGIGCQPKGFIEFDESDDRYWNVIYYDRPLSEEEIRNYDLELIEEVGE